MTDLVSWWEPCRGGARLLKVLGDTPCPVLPAAVEGMPLTEIGPVAANELQKAMTAFGLI